MLRHQKRTAQRFLTIAMLLFMGLLMGSCLPNPFNRWPEPVIDIAEGIPYGTAPLTITFDISASFDPDGEVVSFTFDFGDGADLLEGTDITEPIEHTYEIPGSYFAKLTVKDNGGATGSVWLAIGVYEPTD
ncbi:PKD domain-containing protein [Candidatus Bipolaricaulota bacterium]|nr:PKD domain-containing protein [Candidatus Bipolaricaulota bacterium]